MPTVAALDRGSHDRYVTIVRTQLEDMRALEVDMAIGHGRRTQKLRHAAFIVIVAPSHPGPHINLACAANDLGDVGRPCARADRAPISHVRPTTPWIGRNL